MDSQLVELARRGLRGGTLPRVRDFRTWGGAGSGHGCAVCGEPIEPSAFEIEVAWTEPSGGSGTALMHVKCQAAWLHALQDLSATPRRQDGEPA